MKVHIGTSGWSYSNWKNIFYPKSIKPSEWLSYYARYLKTVEINNSFYMVPKPKILDAWANNTPDDFIFSIKAWNLITHKRKLKNCDENLSFFLSHIENLRSKCGPVLFQLPGNFHKDLNRLKSFINILPKNYLYCFEFRHPSWWCDEITSLLSENNIAFCIFEIGTLTPPRIVTANFIYIRLHGDKEPYVSKYEDDTLFKWQKWIKEQKKDAYIYFDNTDVQDYAIQNALHLLELMKSSAPLEQI